VGWSTRHGLSTKGPARGMASTMLVWSPRQPMPTKNQRDIPRGTAWILGAGFSRSLGGPLMDELFTDRLRHRMQPWLGDVPENLRVNGFHELTRFYQRYDPRTDGPDPNDPRPWSDAEEFLEILDRAVAAGDENAADRRIALGLLRERNPNADTETLARRMAKTARQYLVAALHAFAPEGDVARQERWSPYARWAKKLDANDVVLSFNYDRVVERASKEQIVPARPRQQGEKIYDLFEPGCPWFIKLHGSVDWRLEPGGSVTQGCDPIDILTSDVEPAIASPGPMKSRMTSDVFSSFWKIAEETLRHVRRIIFVGYRMPATDNEAKRRILDAIRANQNPALQIHLVLGPDTSHTHVRRLEGLLLWALRGARPPLQDLESRIHVEPLGAEDFLTVAP